MCPILLSLSILIEHFSITSLFSSFSGSITFPWEASKYNELVGNCSSIILSAISNLFDNFHL